MAPDEMPAAGDVGDQLRAWRTRLFLFVVAGLVPRFSGLDAPSAKTHLVPVPRPKSRHGRAGRRPSPGHPRLAMLEKKTWVAATSTAMTKMESRRYESRARDRRY
jgi:hypothetical protein